MYTNCNLKASYLLYCALIRACAVIRSNTVLVLNKSIYTRDVRNELLIVL